ncbi:MAG: DUF3617 domain-containing protein [Sphingomonadaceae bacterium]|nr:DUF3617 domain-containing protein [Sphingomonadaceae bacterium]
MRRAILMVTVAGAMTLGGCNMFSSDGDSSGKAVDPAKAMADAPEVEPGQYEASMEIVKLEIPGMPAEMQTKMREQMAGVTGVQHRYCVTAEQARRGREDMARQMANAPGGCRFTTFDVSGENVNAAMQCDALPSGGRMTMTMTGTMGANASDMTVKQNASVPNTPVGNMETEMRIRTRRIGDCPAGEATATP